MCDGNVFEGDVEFLSTTHEIGTDAVRDGLTLGDEFCGIELGDNGFEDFVSDGREDTFVVVLSKRLERLSIHLLNP